MAVAASERCREIPKLGRSLPFSIGYPPPPFCRKIQSANDLNFDHVLDL